jgi:hypothetical protein
LIVGISEEIDNNNMKWLAKLIMDFLRKEWFLLVALAAIAAIILAFEYL